MFLKKQEFFAQITATMLWNEERFTPVYNLKHNYLFNLYT